jgi:hypothetical protein
MPRQEHKRICIIKSFDGEYSIQIHGISSRLYEGNESDAPKILQDLPNGKRLELVEESELLEGGV